MNGESEPHESTDPAVDGGAGPSGRVPRYVEVATGGWVDRDGEVWASACSVCGALVSDRGTHSAWHLALAVP